MKINLNKKAPLLNGAFSDIMTFMASYDTFPEFLDKP